MMENRKTVVAMISSKGEKDAMSHRGFFTALPFHSDSWAAHDLSSEMSSVPLSPILVSVISDVLYLSRLVY